MGFWTSFLLLLNSRLRSSQCTQCPKSLSMTDWEFKNCTLKLPHSAVHHVATVIDASSHCNCHRHMVTLQLSCSWCRPSLEAYLPHLHPTLSLHYLHYHILITLSPLSHSLHYLHYHALITLSWSVHFAVATSIITLSLHYLHYHTLITLSWSVRSAVAISIILTWSERSTFFFWSQALKRSCTRVYAHVCVCVHLCVCACVCMGLQPKYKRHGGRKAIHMHK